MFETKYLLCIKNNICIELDLASQKKLIQSISALKAAFVTITTLLFINSFQPFSMNAYVVCLGTTYE